MTRLDKRIAFDMVLFLVTFVIFWTTYQEEYNIMDDIWNIVVPGYIIGSAASIYSAIVTNRYLQDFCIFISFTRISVAIYIFGHIFFEYETLSTGPHLAFIGISLVVSFLLSRTKLILPIRKFVTWLSMGSEN
jgi:hypothetical protein